MGGEEPREPINFESFRTEKNLPTGDQRRNCDTWAVVDFGHGPIEVRCTMAGEHDEHGCLIMFLEDEETTADPDMN